MIRKAIGALALLAVLAGAAAAQELSLIHI